MRKHLKVKCELNPETIEEATLTILEQTHLDYEFGDACSNSHEWTWAFPYGRIMLVSDGVYVHCSKPGTRSCYKDPEDLDMFYLMVLNESSIRNNSNATTIPSSMWPEVRECIEAYNKYFSI